MEEFINAQRLHDSLILVVDDIEMSRRVLVHSLNSQGYSKVITANDGSEALQLTQSHKPDIVILDLMMPNMDGIAYCRAVRKDKDYDSMPIIVQTALDDVEQKLCAFEAGASDYICKPIDPGELCARTRVHLVQKLLTENLLAYRHRVSAEMDAARLMQNRLMPDNRHIEMCERVFDMKIAQEFRTSSALGGDCWGMRLLSASKLAVYMFDFSGHGVSAAMNVFRMHTILQECLDISHDPESMLRTLNHRLRPLLERGEFATMFYGIVDTEEHSLTYASAASPPAMFFSAENGATLLDGKGLPLSVLLEAEYENKVVAFKPGDMLFLYSDCLIETQNEGRFLREEDIMDDITKVLKSAPDNPAMHAIDVVTRRLEKHSNKPIQDDLTLTAYWRRPLR